MIVAATSILRDPIECTAALGAPAPMASLSSEAYRSWPSGGGDAGGSKPRLCRSSRRSHLAMASYDYCHAEGTGRLASTKAMAARGEYMSDAGTSAAPSFPGRERRLTFVAPRGSGLQPVSREVARRGGPGTTLHMSQTSPQVFQPQAERRDGSPTASSIVEGEEEMHGGG
ncbi:unnamed protein product, partial [Laminaria digitata]